MFRGSDVAVTVRILIGHVLDKLRELPDESVHCVVTSPPYYGLRDYGIEPQVWAGECRTVDASGRHCVHGGHAWSVAGRSGQRLRNGLGGSLEGATVSDGMGETLHPSAGSSCLNGCGAWRGSLGLEPTLALYLDHMVEVFREVWRVMRKDATCWLNIGDSYATGAGSAKSPGGGAQGAAFSIASQPNRMPQVGLKPKDLMMVPARLAIRLQDDGWWVRSDIAWCKRAPMPESCADRPTSAWEHVFLLTKSVRYFYDAEAVREPYARDWAENNGGSWAHPELQPTGSKAGHHSGKYPLPGSGANQRNFWLLGPEPFPEAHFATFPTEIPRRAILAGSKPGDTILDLFLGSGTTALVADQLGRNCIGIELNPEYAAMARRRIEDDAPLFAARNASAPRA